MPHKCLLTIFLFFIVLIDSSCKKEKKTTACFPNVATVREINNQPAMIKVTATAIPVYLTEEGAIDTKLIPCNLSKEFIQNDLKVFISGEVKLTRPDPSAPCCSVNFVVTHIIKR